MQDVATQLMADKCNKARRVHRIVLRSIHFGYFFIRLHYGLMSIPSSIRICVEGQKKILNSVL